MKALALCLVVCMSLGGFMPLRVNAAGASEIAAAEKAVAEAQAVIDKGSLGFFEYVGAENAAAVLKDSRLKSNTDIGAENDATSLENMYWAVRWIPICNKLRAGDPNFTETFNHSALMVNDTLMAIAQKQCNGSAALLSAGSYAPHTGAYESDILAWGYKYKNLTSEREKAGPYNDWYYYERDHYESGSGETSHYFHMMRGYYSTGTAVSQNVKYQSMDCQVFSAYQGGREVYYWQYNEKTKDYEPFLAYTLEATDYTADEYIERFDAYYNMVYTNLEAAEAALAKAQGYTITADSLSVTPSLTTLVVGETGSLTVRFSPSNATERSLVYKSSASRSVSVDDEGNFTALWPVRGDGDSPGQATISVTTVSGARGTAKVEVLFQDVTDSSYYYYKPVYWAFNNQITTGRSSGDVFDPSATCTRAEIVTFLWRLAGKPEPTYTEGNPFKDVSENAYYYQAVLWAVEQGITTGRSKLNDDGTKNFDPKATCTRREIVTFLWRYAGRPKASIKESPFNDVTDSSAYYYRAVLWAVDKGITTGKSGGERFDPLGLCTRGMSVTFLYRYAY